MDSLSTAAARAPSAASRRILVGLLPSGGDGHGRAVECRRFVRARELPDWTLGRNLARTLNGRFIRVRNRNEYPPQDKNPKGEIHEDEGFISFDRARKKPVLRQFHIEGFVNQYVEDGDSSPKKVVFTSESIENIPAGWRARETYVVHGPHEFEEIFELAESGKPFELYSRARLKRVQ